MPTRQTDNNNVLRDSVQRRGATKQQQHNNAGCNNNNTAADVGRNAAAVMEVSSDTDEVGGNQNRGGSTDGTVEKNATDSTDNGNVRCNGIGERDKENDREREKDTINDNGDSTSNCDDNGEGTNRNKEVGDDSNPSTQDNNSKELDIAGEVQKISENKDKATNLVEKAYDSVIGTNTSTEGGSSTNNKKQSW